MIFQIQFQTHSVAFLYSICYLVLHCMCTFGLNDISLLYTKNEKRRYMLIDLYYGCEYYTKYIL